jgi:hypothetical protein
MKDSLKGLSSYDDDSIENTGDVINTREKVKIKNKTSPKTNNLIKDLVPIINE